MSERGGIDPQEHRVFSDPSRVAVLETVLGARRPLGVREIAEAVGLHVNTVRAHLSRLEERGLVTARAERRDRRGRPRTLYAAREESGPRDYRLLAEALVAAAAGADGDGRAAAVAAGHAQGVRIAGAPEYPVSAGRAVARVVEVLDAAGFRPCASADGRRIELRNCPFRELSERAPEVVCGVHLGVVRGVLRGLGAPVTATRLRPFAEPGLCTVELGPARRRSGPAAAPDT